MLRSVFAMALGSLLFCGATALADEDLVMRKLDAAKVTYESNMEKFRATALEWFDKRDEAARKDGNKKLVDQVKAERQQFEEHDELPRAAPVTMKLKATTARATLEGAFGTAVKEYTRAKKDDEAAVVEKELEAFRSGILGPDLFPVGSKWVGTAETTIMLGKKVSHPSIVEYEVTSRQGNAFTAEVWDGKRLGGCEIKGTIEKDKLSYVPTKSLKGDPILAEDLKIRLFTGKLEKNTLTGVITKLKTDPTYRVEVHVERKRD